MDCARGAVLLLNLEAPFTVVLAVVMLGEHPHSHVHRQAPLFHDHPHLPDVHHRHGH